MPLLDDTQQLDPTPQVDEQKPDTESEVPESRKAAVKRWLDRIDKAESKFEPDFERMRESMDFVTGIQWNGQKGISYDKYIANWTIRAVNQGVATLYARNPQVEVRRNVNRLNYKLWDGKMETIMMATQLAQMSQQFGLPLPPDIPALLQDFQMGRMHEALVDRVAKTLQYLLQNQFDSQSPGFKTQMKQLVRRVNVCGVGYIKVSFCRENQSDESYEDVPQSRTPLSMTQRLQTAKALLDKISNGKIEDSSADIERVKQLVDSFDAHPLDTEQRTIKESILLDFPRSTSILPDPATRTLKGFIGAKWIAERIYLPKKFVESWFEVNLEEKIDDTKYYDQNNKPDEGQTTSGASDKEVDNKVCVYVVRSIEDKSEFTICKGFKDYLCEPEVVSPVPRDFWNIFPVVFNDIEVEEGCQATIFPPSLVDLVKPAQREWNRTRQALRRHRRANGPKYLYVDGTASEEDLDAIVNSEDQEFVKLKGVAPGTQPSKVVEPLGVVDVKPELYEVEPLREDALLTSGQQEANQGPPQPNITATGVHVAEQSRTNVAASDIDGLDDCLTAVADCMAQLNLMEMSSDTVGQLVGKRGAVWPDDLGARRELLDELEIKIQAGSSGKPNQAVELNKWQTISGILAQFGANPQAVIRETIKRFDDYIEPADFFPVGAPIGAPQQQPQQNGQPQQKQKQMQPGRQQPKRPQIPAP
jgi:hypothetical protein